MSKHYNIFKIYSSFDQEPRVITCKFDSRCRETGTVIKKGQQALYFPFEKSIYSLKCKKAQEMWQFNEI